MGLREVCFEERGKEKIRKGRGAGTWEVLLQFEFKEHDFFLFLEIGILSLALGMRSGPDPDLEPDPFGSP